MKRVLFIYNAKAGKSRTWTELSTIIQAMTQEQCLVTAYPTQYRGDAGDAIVRWSRQFMFMAQHEWRSENSLGKSVRPGGGGRGGRHPQ